MHKYHKLLQNSVKLIAFFLISFAIAACDSEKSQVYLGIQANTKATAELTEDLLHSIGKRTKGNLMSIDILKGDSAQTIYSNSISKQTLQELREKIDPNPNTPKMDIIPSSDRALVAGLQRFKDLARANPNQEFHAYILTPGTTDETTLEQIKTICQELASQTQGDRFHIYLLGLTEENRLKTVSALHPIRANAYSAGQSFSEMQKLIRQF